MAISGLGKRVMAAVVLAPAVLAVVWYLSSVALGAVLGLFVLAAGWEWAALSGLRSAVARGCYVVALGISMALCLSLADSAAGNAVVLGAAIAWWAVALAWVVRFQQGLPPAALGSRAARALCGLLVLAPAWSAMVHLHRGADGRLLVIALLAAIWIADIAAYFVGRAFGRHRLASRVSPGKTVEGVCGGLVAVVASVFAGGMSAGLNGIALAALAALCALAAAVSLLGDLSESLFKRVAGVKDSGVLIPGHGGVLDRIDSLTAAAPVFAAGAGLLGRL